MHNRPQQPGTRGVSMDMKTSWAAQEYDSKFSNLETMARFQQKQLQEKEQKLLQLYDQQQQRAYQVVQRGSAGSNSSNHGGSTTTRTTTHTTSTSQGGKVRRLFDERRQTTVKGIDRSYPLEPLENKSRKQTNTNGLTTQRNGNSTMNRQSVNMKRVTRADVNSNVNGGKPVVSYREEIMRESFGPSVRRHDDEDEFGVEDGVATFANGYYRHEVDNEEEEVLDRETVERNRMMAKIHLMEYDDSLKHHARNDLENEEFPEYLMVDVPDRLPKRNVTKKLSQAEARLERFKNTNAKRSNMSKQLTSTSNVIKKRSEQTIPAKSNSRITKSPSPDSATRKHHETNTRATRRSAPSSPSKSPDIASKCASTEPKNQEAKPSRKSAVTKSADSTGSKAVTNEVVDTIDGIALQNGSLHESTTKKSDVFIIDSDDQPAKEGDIVPSKKSPIKKSYSNKQQTASSASDRPTSSNSSASLTHGQVSSTKSKMATRAKTPASAGPQAKGPLSARSSGTSSDLVACKTCGRTFANDRIGYHEKVCTKVVNMKRKKFDAMTFRIKGTELEPFAKKSFKKQETKKPQVKSDWRRKHEDFINTIRSAKQLQAHLAAGGSLKDLPPPPPSDTSDYIQCPHCNRKFNQAAAERHIPKCETMLHNKPAHLRASKPRR
ncbi:Zinc finger C2HC domain-containing protein 1C [Formica fusca]